MQAQKALWQLIDKIEGWGHTLLLLLPNIILAFIVILIFLLLARLVDHVLKRLLRGLSVGHEIVELSTTAVFICITLTGIFIALGVLGLDKTVTSLLAGLGILGLALGLAFQSTGENYVAGIYLSIRRPFTVGQVIECNDYYGVVERIALRSTWLRVPQGQLVNLPNKKIFESPIINYSDSGQRRIDVDVGVSYGEDLEKVQRIATDAIKGVSVRRAGSPVLFYYLGYGSSSINFQVQFWIDFQRHPEYLLARSEAVMCIKRAFDENDITIPFPIRTLDFARVGGETLEEQVRATGWARTPADGKAPRPQA